MDEAVANDSLGVVITMAGQQYSHTRQGHRDAAYATWPVRACGPKAHITWLKLSLPLAAGCEGGGRGGGMASSFMAFLGQ